MSEVRRVQKRLTETALEHGAIKLGRAESKLLALPRHEVSVSCVVGELRFTAEWSPSTDTLHCQTLAEEVLQLEAGVGDQLQLLVGGDGALELTVIDAASSSFVSDVTGWWNHDLEPGHDDRRAADGHGRRGRRRTASAYYLRSDREYEWTGRVGLLRQGLPDLAEEIRKGGWDDPAQLELRLQGERLALLDSFESLLVRSALPIELFPWQEAAARTLLSRMRGRGVLADEVGLGKTIEAGAVIKELVLRRQLTSAVILCPGALREQWREELDEKFGLSFSVAYRGADIGSDELGDLLIMTPQMLRNARQLGGDLDLVVVDEAHKLGPKGRQRVRDLDARRVVLMTATPVQNRLTELWEMLEVVRPGMFASKRDFVSRYVDSRDPQTPRNVRELREMLANVMIRTTRAQAGIDRVRRAAVDVPVTVSNTERRIYELALELVRRHLSDGNHAHRRRYLALRMASSPRSFAKTLDRLRSHVSGSGAVLLEEIVHLAADLDVTPRQRALIERILAWRTEGSGGVLVFSQHTDTIEDLARVLELHGIEAQLYHGAMSRTQKAEAIGAFTKGGLEVLLATDAGAEGLNLQRRCHHVVNYDLPWNPMKIEQRIGRVHRLDQPSDVVHVANFWARGTVEERVYELLHHKLRMFELLFGQVTTILGELETDAGDRDRSFEQRILDAVAADDEVMERKLARFGAELESATDAVNSEGAVLSSNELSSWLDGSSGGGRFGHRDQLIEDDGVLQPPDLEVGDDRDAQVEQFVHGLLTGLGCTVIRSDPGFASYELSPEVIDAVGVPELHLAFTHEGLDAHRDAELCTLGSEVFEELLTVLRHHGDLVAMAPLPPPDDLDVPPHSHRVRLVGRTVSHASPPRVQGVWRASSGDGQDEDLVVVDTAPPAIDGSDPPGRRRARPLLGGAELPPFRGGDLSELLSAHQATAVARLTAHADHVRASRQARLDEAQAKLIEHYSARIEDLHRQWDDRSDPDALLRSIRELERSRAHAAEVRAPEPTVRAEPLALTFTFADDIQILERWERLDGDAEVEIRYRYAPRSPYDYPDATGQPVGTVHLCSSGHMVDEAVARSCEGCPRETCPGCEDHERAACLTCARRLCFACRPATADICDSCLVPVRAPDEDDERGIAFRLRDGRVMHADDDVIELVGEERPWVRDADVRRQVLGRWAIELDLPVRARALTVPCPSPAPTPDALVTATRYRWDRRRPVPPDAGPFPVDALRPLPRVEPVADLVPDTYASMAEAVWSHPDIGIARANVPGFLVTLVHELFELLSTPTGFVVRHSITAPGAPEPSVTDHELTGTGTTERMTFAHEDVPEVEVECQRHHGTVVCDVRFPEGIRSRFIAGDPDLPKQLALAEVAASLGAAGSILTSSGNVPPTVEDGPHVRGTVRAWRVAAVEVDQGAGGEEELHSLDGLSVEPVEEQSPVTELREVPEAVQQMLDGAPRTGVRFLGEALVEWCGTDGTVTVKAEVGAGTTISAPAGELDIVRGRWVDVEALLGQQLSLDTAERMGADARVPFAHEQVFEDGTLVAIRDVGRVGLRWLGTDGEIRVDATPSWLEPARSLMLATEQPAYGISYLLADSTTLHVVGDVITDGATGRSYRRPGSPPVPVAHLATAAHFGLPLGTRFFSTVPVQAPDPDALVTTSRVRHAVERGHREGAHVVAHPIAAADDAVPSIDEWQGTDDADRVLELAFELTTGVDLPTATVVVGESTVAVLRPTETGLVATVETWESGRLLDREERHFTIAADEDVSERLGPFEILVETLPGALQLDVWSDGDLHRFEAGLWSFADARVQREAATGLGFTDCVVAMPDRALTTPVVIAPSLRWLEAMIEVSDPTWGRVSEEEPIGASLRSLLELGALGLVSDERVAPSTPPAAPLPSWPAWVERLSTPRTVVLEPTFTAKITLRGRHGMQSWEETVRGGEDVTVTVPEDSELIGPRRFRPPELLASPLLPGHEDRLPAWLPVDRSASKVLDEPDGGSIVLAVDGPRVELVAMGPRSEVERCVRLRDDGAGDVARMLVATSAVGSVGVLQVADLDTTGEIRVDGTAADDAVRLAQLASGAMDPASAHPLGPGDVDRLVDVLGARCRERGITVPSAEHGSVAWLPSHDGGTGLVLGLLPARSVWLGAEGLIERIVEGDFELVVRSFPWRDVSQTEAIGQLPTATVAASVGTTTARVRDYQGHVTVEVESDAGPGHGWTLRRDEVGLALAALARAQGIEDRIVLTGGVQVDDVRWPRVLSSGEREPVRQVDALLVPAGPEAEVGRGPVHDVSALASSAGIPDWADLRDDGGLGDALLVAVGQADVPVARYRAGLHVAETHAAPLGLDVELRYVVSDLSPTYQRHDGTDGATATLDTNGHLVAPETVVSCTDCDRIVCQFCASEPSSPVPCLLCKARVCVTCRAGASCTACAQLVRLRGTENGYRSTMLSPVHRGQARSGRLVYVRRGSDDAYDIEWRDRSGALQRRRSTRAVAKRHIGHER